MKRIEMILFFAVLLLLNLPLSGASEGSPVSESKGERSFITYSVNNGSSLSLAGTTNINSFECLSTSYGTGGYLFADAFRDDNRIYFNEAELMVNVSTFDCKNPLITRDMHKALGGAGNTGIEISLLDAEMAGTDLISNEGYITANVLITIKGVSMTKELQVYWKREHGFEYSLKGVTELKMSDFGIVPPSPAMGLVRVNDIITVDFKYNFQHGIISRLD